MRLNYDEISPITGNLCVLTEREDTTGKVMRLCMESGYQTFDYWKEGSEAVDKFLESSPELIKATKVVDEDGNVWLKIIMMTQDVVLNPDLLEYGDGSIEVVWKVSSFKVLEEGELPPPHMVTVKIGDRYKVLDESTCKMYGEFDFESATEDFYRRVSKIEE